MAFYVNHLLEMKSFPENRSDILQELDYVGNSMVIEHGNYFNFSFPNLAVNVINSNPAMIGVKVTRDENLLSIQIMVRGCML
jgi:hypothetical protein